MTMCTNPALLHRSYHFSTPLAVHGHKLLERGACVLMAAAALDSTSPLTLLR
jgi:hypothetical protein